MIRIAKDSDVAFLSEHDRHVPLERLQHKIDTGQVYIYLEAESPLGWLRFSHFWDLRPFMDMLFILEDHRGRGIGRVEPRDHRGRGAIRDAPHSHGR